MHSNTISGLARDLELKLRHKEAVTNDRFHCVWLIWFHKDNNTDNLSPIAACLLLSD